MTFIILGSSFLGYLDYWSGVLAPSVTSYNIDAILNSTTANILSQVNYDRLTPNFITSLRNNLTVRCNFKKDTNPCNPFKKPCLFNIAKDPCEQINLNYKPNSKLKKFVEAKIEYFELLLNNFRKSASKPGNVRGSSAANPFYHNNTWVSWEDESII